MAIIVDFSTLTFRMMFGSKNGVIENPPYLAHLILRATYNNIREFKVSIENPLVIAVDCTKSDIWRKPIYEKGIKKFPEYKEKGYTTYKGQRKYDPTIPWAEVREIMDAMVAMFRDYTDAIVLYHPNAEADDCIKVACDYFANDHVVIISGDGDFKQLVSDTVQLYDPIQKKYHVHDPDYLTKHILQGDGGDGILGCKKLLGPKTAVKMLHNLEGELVVDKRLAERYEFNKSLIDLNYIPDNIYGDIMSQLELDPFNFNMSKALRTYMKYGLQQAADDVSLLKFRHEEVDHQALY